MKILIRQLKKGIRSQFFFQILRVDFHQLLHYLRQETFTLRLIQKYPIIKMMELEDQFSWSKLEDLVS